MTNAKQEAKKLIETLPDEASWDDIMYRMYVLQKISIGEKAAETGQTLPHDQVKKMFPA